MDDVLKRRVVGAAVLIGIGVLVPVLVVKLAQPSVPPAGESVRVYEITPSGETRPLDKAEKPGKQSNTAQSVASAQPAGKKQSLAADTSDGKTPNAEPKPASKPQSRPEAIAPTAQRQENQPKAKVKPEAEKPAPKPQPKPKPAPKPAPTPQPAEPKPVAPPPKPASQPAPVTKPESSAPHFVVQVGSFGEESNAISLMQELRREFPVYYREGELNGKRLYRVRVGPFDSRESADIVGTRLRQRGLKTQTLSLP